MKKEDRTMNEKAKDKATELKLKELEAVTGGLHRFPKKERDRDGSGTGVGTIVFTQSWEEKNS